MRKAVLLHYDFYDMFLLLTDEEIGKLIKAAFEYDMNGVLPDFNDRMLENCFMQIRRFLDRNSAHYDEVCFRRSEAAKKKWEKFKNQSVEN
ncbi:MAG: hypothetical protein IJB74_06045 [Clostridia bacterium]|nr:hypothetical protein [Clostridia bacterium]